MHSYTKFAVYIVIAAWTFVGFTYTYRTATTIEYRIEETKPVEKMETILVPEVKSENPDKQKNKLLTQARVIREIGSAPQVKTYQTDTRYFTEKDFNCLALNVYHEARGEDIAGMVAVAQVTLNRLDVNYRGKRTLCEIVYDSAQFSWTLSKAKRNERPKGESWEKVRYITQKVVQGMRIRGLEKNLHYHSDWIPHPDWSKKMALNHVIGQHIYLRRAT